MSIYQVGDALVLGSGWYPPERSGEQVFRWASNDARVNVAQLLPSATAFSLLIEPGPGVKLKPFELMVRDERGECIAACKVRGKETVSFELPPAAPCVHRLTLHVENGGTLMHGDDRVLNFRVFKVSVVQLPPEIVSLESGVTAGSGWYPLETFNDATFRWAGNEAVLQVPKPTSNGNISLDVEPGPGMDYAPFDLTVADGAGRVLKTIAIGKRQIIELPLEGGTSTLHLKVVRNGKPSVGDARIMNYRAFSFIG